VTEFTFRQPSWLWLLALVPVLAVARAWSLGRLRRAVPFPPAALLEALGGRNRSFPWVSSGLALASLAFMIVALARPATRSSRTTVTTEGVAIMLVLDISGSMVAEDFKPDNRIDVARSVLADFVRKRPDDRLGLITFSAMPFLRCPLTSDHKTLLDVVGAVRTASGTDWDGTAIGDALVAAGKRLLSAPEKSKVVILLTDGENNRGQFDPLQSAQLLAAHKIRVDAVGIGSTGVVPYPIVDENGRKNYQYVHIGFNEEALRAIAKATDGVYYNASNTRGLEQVFEAIDRLEKSKVSSNAYVRYGDLFPVPLGFGLLCLCLAVTWLAWPGRSLP